MSGNEKYFWIPGNARHDRGYTLEEALVAVGPGWAPLVEEAWRAVTEVGGGVIQVKEKRNSLRIYFLAPPEHTATLERLMDALEERSAEIDQGRREWSEVEAFKEMIAWQQPADQPEWWREAIGENLFRPPAVERVEPAGPGARLAKKNQLRAAHFLSLPGVDVRREEDDLVIYHQGLPLLWQNPQRVSGQVCFHGSRLPLSTPLSVLAGGTTLEEIAEGWPTASPEVMGRLIHFLCVLIDPEADW
jgi:uncharacterized protein (DUF433 family)